MVQQGQSAIYILAACSRGQSSLQSVAIGDHKWPSTYLRAREANHHFSALQKEARAECGVESPRSCQPLDRMCERRMCERREAAHGGDGVAVGSRIGQVDARRCKELAHHLVEERRVGLRERTHRVLNLVIFQSRGKQRALEHLMKKTISDHQGQSGAIREAAGSRAPDEEDNQ